MIDCLNNYIGVLGVVGLDDPDSGYYINDLYGITTQKLEDIADSEDHYEVRLAFDEIWKRAERKFEADIKDSMKKYFKRYSYIQNGITGQLTKSTSIAQSNSYTGRRFDFGFKSKNLVLNISSFDLYLVTAVNFDVIVFDLNTGLQLDLISYTGTVGLNTYRWNKNYAVHRNDDLFIAYNAQTVDTIEMDEYKPNSFNSSGTIGRNASLLSANFTSAVSGMSVTYNLECSVSNFVCQRIDNFKDGLLFLLGIEAAKEVLYSTRINRWTLMDRDDAKELLESYTKDYEIFKETSLKDLQIQEDDICFQCQKAVNYSTVLP